MPTLPRFASRTLLPLSLALLLAACGGGTAPVTPPAPPAPPAPICPQGEGAALVSAQQVAGLAESGTSAPVAGAPAVWSAPHVPGRVLVVGGGLQAQGALLGVQSRALGAGLTLVQTPTGQTDAAFAAQLQAQGLRVQPDYLYHPLANPNDPGVPGNGGVPLVAGGVAYTQTYLGRIQAPAAWTFLQACGKTPVAAKTAILDARVDNHPDLAARIAERASFLTPEAGGSDSESGHGTASAGLVGATTNNGAGLAGVTWSGPLMALEVLGANGGSTSSLAQALNAAVAGGAKVINLSLGRPLDPNEPAGSSDQVLSAALTNAAKSAVIVAAAGNTAGDGVYFPASHPDVVAVGALGTSDTALACYSARPSTARPRALNIVAPGGVGNCAGATNAGQMLILTTGGGYTLSAGTSFAAPLVSGAAALMRAANPGLSAAETKQRLLESANTAVAGLPRLDVNAAVRAATR
ncbi:S8 family serine peptidase [Deinococcus aquaedulcis]|uniref:S8 family serine peptidase n=1 Tax=Deinococcus aquaedulcis TaxID=2840455 RepID=UPI001C82E274|nr:S8 family serine peptidase [Deinococcus aquaedulcis]